MNELDSLRALLCGIGVVGNIDGHDVIRRESVIDLVDRALASKPDAAPARTGWPAGMLQDDPSELSKAFTQFENAVWLAWQARSQARASSAAPAGHEAGRCVQGARTEPLAPSDAEPAPTLESAYADGRADQFEEDKELLGWAYGKLHHVSFTKQEDALQLDRIKLMFMGGPNV